MTNRNLLGTVLRTICRHLDNDIIRSTLVAAVDDPKTGIGTAAMIIAELAADRGLGPIRRGNAEDISSLTREQVEELGNRISHRIGDMASSDILPVSSMTDYILAIWTSFCGPKGARTWVNKKVQDPSEFPSLIFATIMNEILSSNAPYRSRHLRNDIDEAVFDLSELLCLAKQYLKADELAEDDKPDIERFITGVEERLRTGPECLPPELEATVAAHRGVSE